MFSQAASQCDTQVLHEDIYISYLFYFCVKFSNIFKC